MPERTLKELAAWARRVWPGGDPGELQVEPIAADGSPRIFARLAQGGKTLVGLANPENSPENRAWQTIAAHLGGLGIPVARVLAADSAAGHFLMADLGRTSLQQAALACGGDPDRLFSLYEPILSLLARLQAHGQEGFDLSVCFDGQDLDPDFLRQREAGYFLAEMVAGALGRSPGEWPRGLGQDIAGLARLAGEARPRGLVHRDFQSRNIIVEERNLGLVDFQGARLGPAQYDLASLINDPYVDLDWSLRERLKLRYLELRKSEGPFNGQAFGEGWPFVALSRAMQALGAYAYLTRKRGKIHFLAYISSGLRTLRALAQGPALEPFPAFKALVSSLPREPSPTFFTPLNEAQV